jgi:hypothetical protein
MNGLLKRSARVLGLFTALCSVGNAGTLTYREAYATEDASAYALMSGDFGWLSGEADAIGYRAGYGHAMFAGAFSDYVWITGGTGSGTMTAVFDVAFGGFDVALQFVAGSTLEVYSLWDFCLTPCSVSGLFGVMTPFAYNEWTSIGAFVSGAAAGGSGTGQHSFASVALTGFIVPDASGDGVFVDLSDVRRMNSSVNFFDIPPLSKLPEPGSLVLLASGLGLLAVTRRLATHRRSRSSVAG